MSAHARTGRSWRWRGVTVLRSAEGPALRSDGRWTAEGARRTMALLDRMVAHRRPAATGSPDATHPPRASGHGP